MESVPPARIELWIYNDVIMMERWGLGIGFGKCEIVAKVPAFELAVTTFPAPHGETGFAHHMPSPPRLRPKNVNHQKSFQDSHPSNNVLPWLIFPRRISYNFPHLLPFKGPSSCPDRKETKNPHYKY